MRRAILTIITISLITTVFFSIPVFAQVRVTIPSFPSCAKPQGEVIALYNTGIHGIPGDTATHTGSDAVYNLSADTLTQCFCSEEDDGIQTNWWKVSSLTEDEVQYLKALGWIYIPNGAEWGLKEAPYMAQNTQYSCATPKTPNTSHSHGKVFRDSDSGSHRGGIGQVLSASTQALGIGGQVLGLASTGNIIQLIVIGVITVTLLVMGIKLTLKKNDK